MPRFTIPRDIHYGRESIGLLSTIRGKRAMLVTVGGEMKQRGILSRAETALRRTGMEVRLLEANNLEHVEQAVAEGAPPCVPLRGIGSWRLEVWRLTQQS